MFFDTHAHYDDEQFDQDRGELLSSLPRKGVSLVVNPASNVSSIYKSVALAESYDYIYAAAGVHPHDSAGMKYEDLDVIAKALSHPKVVALGEVGLDYHYDFSPREVQRKRFAGQLALAAELSFPVIIHDREAHEDILSAISRFKGLRGVFHCYTGSLEMAKVLVRMGFYISFTGIITFQNARKSHEVIKWMPRDRLMIETDSPYLSPVPNRGKRNDSTNLVHTAAKAAELLGLSLEETAALTMKNGREFFNI